MVRRESERFALEMIRACLPFTTTNLQPYGFWQHMCMENDGLASRTVSVTISSGESDLRLAATCNMYVLLEDGSRDWREARCTISRIDGDHDEEWVFYCDKRSGTVVVEFLSTMRRRRALRELIERTLGNLGALPETVAKRLHGLGYEPTAAGISSMLSDLFSPNFKIELIEDSWSLLPATEEDARLFMRPLPLPRPMQVLINTSRLSA